MTEADFSRRLTENLNVLKLNGMEMNIKDYLRKIERKEISLVQGLCELTDIEVRMKQERVIHGCVKVANFPFLKTLDDFDFDFQPSSNREEIYGLERLDFLENKENVIFIGSPGVGKTHLSVALGVEAAKNRKSTYFVNCHELILDLKEAQKENRLEKRLKHYAHYRLLIIDEVGFLPMDEEGSKLLFQLISRRYEKNSTIVTTNIDLSRWKSIFGDPIMAHAILDRLLHHSTIINIVGESYRLKGKIPDFQETVSSV